MTCLLSSLVQFRFQVEPELDQRKNRTTRSCSWLETSKTVRVPVSMRNSVFEEGKTSRKTGAMLLMPATLPFMSAYVVLGRYERKAGAGAKSILLLASRERIGSKQCLPPF
jgi:hypothetical protein